jgi:hypothetical protein
MRMNTGRFLGAAAVVWVVRVLLNWLYYGVWMADTNQAMANAHPGIFREVIPAYIAADLIFAVFFVFLFVKVVSCLGGGIRAGVMLAILIAILSQLLGSIYTFYSLTVYPADMMITDSIYQLVSHVISGVLAAVVYKA